MLPKIPVWSISMLGNTIFEASSLLGCPLFNKCNDLYHIMFRGYGLEVGVQKMGPDYSTTIDDMHA